MECFCFLWHNAAGGAVLRPQQVLAGSSWSSSCRRPTDLFAASVTMVVANSADTHGSELESIHWLLIDDYQDDADEFYWSHEMGTATQLVRLLSAGVVAHRTLQEKARATNCSHIQGAARGEEEWPSVVVARAERRWLLVARGKRIQRRSLRYRLWPRQIPVAEIPIKEGVREARRTMS